MLTVEGDDSRDDRIRQLYHEGLITSEIAQRLGVSKDRVRLRLRSLERYGLVERRSNGLWSEGICSATGEIRPCGKAEFSIMSRVCISCKYRAKPTWEQ